MMKGSVLFLLALASLVAVATTALAGEREGAFSISPFVAGYTFDGTQHLDTAPAFGLRLGYDLTKHWGVEGVADYLQTSHTKTGTTKKMVSYRVDLLYNFTPDGPLVPYLAVGGGGLTYGGNGITINEKNTDATANVGFGLKYFMTDKIALRGDARQLFVMEDPNAPKYNWEYSVGVTFLLGKGSTPVAAATTSAHAAPAHAAPVPRGKMTVNPPSITRGQSSTLSWTSQNTVTCSMQPGIGTVAPEGAMVVTPSVTTDYLLACEGPGGTATSTAHISVAAVVPQSAPAPAPAQKKRVTIEFAVGNADVSARYYDELRKIALYLKDHSGVKGVVEGHTDSMGDEAYNAALSERRAQGVKQYIVDQFGIDPFRLSTRGYGASRPVSDNMTSDGRQMNRRAVIILEGPEK
jgi:OmpA-OmpF porin, OOP family